MVRSSILPLIVCAVALLLTVGASGQPQPSKPDAASPTVDYWVGTFFMPDAAAPEARFVVTFTQDPATKEWSATLDIPVGPGMSGSIGVQMKEVVHTDTKLGFLSPAPPADNLYEATRGPDGTTAEGRVMVSRMQPLPIRMHRVGLAVADACRARRPQTPQPPFPYTQRDVSITNPTDGTVIGGTLTIPGGAGPFPSIALISDAGPHTRDHEEGTHRPYAVLADQLARRGIAVLRTDDRGIGRSTGSQTASTLDDAARDAVAAAVFLRSQPELDPARTGLLGRGEGALVAAKAAAASTDVGFVILLAPAGFPGAKVLPQSQGAILGAQGDRADYISDRGQHLAHTLGLLVEKAPDAEVRGAIAADVKSRVAAKHDWGDLNDAQLAQGIDAQFNTFTTARFRSWAAEDPAASLGALKCPVLALFAERDMTIPAAPNMPRVKSLLEAGGSADREVALVPGVNHYFQRCGTGFDEEHDRIEETVAPEVIDRIAAFLSRRAAGPGGAP
jgi:uncharacterized protein